MVKKTKYILSLTFLLGFLSVQAQTTDEELAYYYYNNDDFEKANLYLEKVYKESNSRQNYDYYIKTLLALKDYKTAEKIARKQIKAKNNKLRKNYFYIMNLGFILNEAGEKEKADKYYKGLIDELNNKNSYSEFSSLGYEFARVNQLDYALETYKKGEKIIDNPNLSFELQIADIYGRQDKVDLMIDSYLNYLSKRENQLSRIQAQLSRSIDFTDENSKKAESLRIKLLRKIQKNPSKTVYNRLLIWYYQQKGNFEGAFTQVKALDKRSKSEGADVYKFARLSKSNKRYDLAVRAYEYVLTNFDQNNYYYASSKREILSALNDKITSSPSYTKQDLNKLETSYIETLNETKNYQERTPIVLDLANFEIYYQNKLDTATSLLNEVLGYPGIGKKDIAKAKIAKGDVLLIQNKVWEASLLYMQVDKMFKEDVIGSTAKLKNAKLYYYTGDYEWCQNQLNGLKASTSKLISNDAIDLSLLITDNYNMDTTVKQMNRFSRADLLILQNKYKEAQTNLDSILADNSEHSLADEILFKKYEISFKKRDYPKAESYLNQIVDKYSEDILADNALFQLGDLYENQLPNEKKAIDTYEKLLFDYPGSLFIVEARKRYRYYRETKPALFENKINTNSTDSSFINDNLGNETIKITDDTGKVRFFKASDAVNGKIIYKDDEGIEHIINIPE